MITFGSLISLQAVAARHRRPRRPAAINDQPHRAAARAGSAAARRGPASAGIPVAAARGRPSSFGHLAGPPQPGIPDTGPRPPRSAPDVQALWSRAVARAVDPVAAARQRPATTATARLWERAITKVLQGG
jgi:hypothetical protein